jgi:zinc protease
MVEHGWKMALMAVGLLASVPSASAATKVEQVTSPGGIQAYLVSEPSIPFLAMSIHFKGGSALDPVGKEGLAYMVSGLLDEGAGELDSQAFRSELVDLAIQLSFDAQRDGFTGELKTLTEHRERAFELLRLALSAPRFDAEPVERIRNQIAASLRRSSEDPDYLASLTWFETAFAGEPYGRPVRGTLESVAGLEVADFRAFVADRLAKDNLVIGVAGDVSAAELGVL